MARSLNGAIAQSSSYNDLLWEHKAHALSGILRLRVQSPLRTQMRIAASIAFLFRACSKVDLDTIALGSCGPRTAEHNTLQILKIQAEIHFRAENADENTKNTKLGDFCSFFRILVCCFGSDMHVWVYFQDSKGFVFCMGSA